jgi:hypothetical protein
VGEALTTTIARAPISWDGPESAWTQQAILANRPRDLQPLQDRARGK